MINPNTSFQQLSIRILRVAIAIIFLAHAVTRIFLPGSFDQFAMFFESKGWPLGKWWVTAITAFEIGGSVLLLIPLWVKWIAAGLICILLTGIFLIHLHLGWFVGEHGTGGCEYSFLLIVSLLVVAAHEPSQKTTRPG